MATTLDQIADLFLAKIQDYKITTLFQTSGSQAVNTYVEPWLLDSIDDFSLICDQTLSYSRSTQAFSLDLSQKNQNVLSRLMQKYWLEKEVYNIIQMQNHLQDKDFKTYSAANNLEKKLNLLDEVYEKADQLLTRYSLNYTIDWDNWENQTFR